MILIAVVVIAFVGYKLITGISSRRSASNNSPGPDAAMSDPATHNQSYFPSVHSPENAMHTSGTLHPEHTHTPLNTADSTIGNDSSSASWSGSDSSSFSSDSTVTSSDSF